MYCIEINIPDRYSLEYISVKLQLQSRKIQLGIYLKQKQYIQLNYTMDPKQKNQIKIDSAYEEVNFYDHRHKNTEKPVASCVKGPSEFNGLFSSQFCINGKQINQLKNERPKDEEVLLNAQPLFMEQVDHNIQQIGLMAVKQVRYVTDSQWEEMMRQQEKFMKEMKKLDSNYKYESRKRYASKRRRNKRGQFVPKQEEKKEGKQEGIAEKKEEKVKKIRKNNKKGKIFEEE